MSKVKGEIYSNNKTKLIHCLRRKESKKKEKSRVLKYPNVEYRCCRGYYLHYDYNNNEYTNRLHRINTNIKSIRKLAQRRVRYSSVGELYQRSSYKKLYDVEWTYVL